MDLSGGYKNTHSLGDKFLGLLLRYGCYSACAVTLFGGILYVLQSGGKMPDYQHFDGVPLYLQSITTLWHHLLQGDGATIVQLGVLMLIATPILRVVVSVVVFAIEGDRLYVLITLVVLAIIVGNMLLGVH